MWRKTMAWLVAGSMAGMGLPMGVRAEVRMDSNATVEGSEIPLDHVEQPAAVDAWMTVQIAVVNGMNNVQPSAPVPTPAAAPAVIPPPASTAARATVMLAAVQAPAPAVQPPAPAGVPVHADREPLRVVPFGPRWFGYLAEMRNAFEALEYLRDLLPIGRGFPDVIASSTGADSAYYFPDGTSMFRFPDGSTALSFMDCGCWVTVTFYAEGGIDTLIRGWPDGEKTVWKADPR